MMGKWGNCGGKKEKLRGMEGGGRWDGRMRGMDGVPRKDGGAGLGFGLVMAWLVWGRRVRMDADGSVVFVVVVVMVRKRKEGMNEVHRDDCA